MIIFIRNILTYMLFSATAFSENVERIVLDALKVSGKKADLSFLNSNKKEEMIILLRDIASGKRDRIGTVLPDSMAAQTILLRIADPPTIKNAVAAYHAARGSRGGGNRMHDLVGSKQAAIIPHLAADFFREDGEKSTFRSVGGDAVAVRTVPLSVFSSYTSLQIAAASEQFSQETRHWANARLGQGLYPYPQLREEMRRWWKQNEAAFQAGDYLAVKPPLPERPPSPPNVESIKRVNVLPPAVVAPPMVESPKPVVAPPAVPSPEPPVAETSHVWLWWGGIAGLIVVLAYALKRRK